MNSTPEDPFVGRDRCSHCGAVAADASGRYCEYCGKALDEPAAPPAAVEDDRFVRLQESPLWAELMAHEPRVPGADRALGETLAAIAFVVVVGIATTIGFLGVCAPLALLPVFGMGAMLALILKRPTPPHADVPLERLAALVHDSRTSLASDDPGRRDSKVHTTLELRDGARREVLVLEHLADRVGKGDFGVAYLRGATLVDFQRVESA